MRSNDTMQTKQHKSRAVAGKGRESPEKSRQKRRTKTKARESEAATPMIAQFIELKAANPGYLLFYRMGDFYELFFEDAIVASRALGITLTKRGKHQGEDIPMCGVPIHRGDEYLQKLIRLGHRVAVCEQMEDPAEAKKRGSKAVVRRDVVRLVTPGTLTEDSLLESRENNFLAALFEVPVKEGPANRYALAAIDISTGELEMGEIAEGDLVGEVARLLPREVLVRDDRAPEAAIARAIEAVAAAETPVPRAYFNAAYGERALKEGLGVGEIAGFGQFSRHELAAAGAALKYVELTQIGARPVLRPPRRLGGDQTLVIDAATRKNLELMTTLAGGRQGSLLHAIDRTVTAAGARILAARLASPLRDPKAISERLDGVGFLVAEEGLREALRELLRGVPDMARALSRLSLRRGGPRDLGAIRDGLEAAERAAACLVEAREGETPLPGEIAEAAAELSGAPRDLGQELARALADDLPPQVRDGGFVREGYRADLDENRRFRDESRHVIAELEAKYRSLTSIKSLKVRHNNMLGYFVEVGANHAETLRGPPHDETFRHRQTLANAVRFTSDELAELEGRITAASERAQAIETEVFAQLRDAVVAEAGALTALAGALAVLDHTAGLATLAVEQNYVRPRLDQSTTFEVIGGRHPVVEQALARRKEAPFIENDCILGRPRGQSAIDELAPAGPLPSQPEADGDLTPRGFDEAGEARILIVTGPNMAGKSTYLRQNALIAILAQMGSYVPARAAHIGVVDRLFSRVGASDDLARGRSTFMVEMVETAGILNQASERSLVILDEIGRGTATFDGLSIAWATVEHLDAVNRCRALFATHYHELTALAGALTSVANATIEVKEWQDEIVFLHKVVPGAADRSYGIQVAKLAGLPPAVIARASEVLALLEKSDERIKAETLLDELPLFAPLREAPRRASAGEPAAESAVARKLEEAVRALEPDTMSPREALDAIYRLRALLEGEGP